MIYCINRIKKEKVAGQRTAGKKAPDDIARIVESKLNGEIIPFFEPDGKGNRYIKSLKSYFINIGNWNRVFKKIKPGDWVIIQHPYEGAKQGYKKIEKCNKLGAITVVLIHDISLERKDIDFVESNVLRNMTMRSETEVLKLCKYIICHNPKMKQYLIEHGIKKDKIFCLGIFDYIFTGTEIPDRKFKKEICVAGNLSKSKSGYLYKYMKDPINCVLKLYGPNYDAQSDECIQYMGTLPPDELPGKLEGSFGLVWDGNDTKGCTGVAGEYIRINNPHKCSLYLASNMPVIIWKQAALADYIVENGLGIAVEKLEDIKFELADLSEEKYNIMMENVKRVGCKIRNGSNFINTFSKIREDMLEAK
ncbi:MAG: hypothetical protein Q4C58_07920 [Eubacteriales bacterium]|nr:hypothetical protein [Eubacteriales bacterium]